MGPRCWCPVLAPSTLLLRTALRAQGTQVVTTAGYYLRARTQQAQAYFPMGKPFFMMALSVPRP
jgi:hypothetical protein